ncbi:MAG: efflux transporter outer membrane subunit [Pedobacter sp.]|nr:MAG: efflux transporter outer membrane subunit [Pedobacter sp.]
MNIKHNKIYAVLILSTVFLAACVTKKYERPAVVSENLYRDNNTSDTTTIADLPWKNIFSDAALQTLIEQGLQENLDLKQAIERIKIAEATLQQSRAAFLPSLSGDVSVTDAKQSRAALNFPPGININTETQTYRAQLSTSWEADIWGKLSSSKRSAYASLLQTDAAKRAVQTQLIANIANTYYTLLSLDKQLAITEQTIKIRQSDVETMKALKEGAVVNGAAVVQSEANLYAAMVTIPDLKRSILEAENSLSIILGRGPGSITRTTIDDQKIFSGLQTGISTQLLKNRPDVQSAEYGLIAAFENKNVAKTFFYPSLTLTATGGLSTLDLNSFFNNSIFYNLIGGITQPIFNRGQNKARLKTAEAQQQIAFLSFQQSLLTGGQEVSNALLAYRTASDKELMRAKQIESLTKAVDFTKELLRYSSATNYTDVLTSEQSLLNAQLNGINDKLQKLQSVVNLYRALGGGWKY